MATISLVLTAYSFASCEAFIMTPSSLPKPSKVVSEMQSTKSTTSCNSSTTQEWDVERYQDQHSFVWEHGSSLIDLLQPTPGQRILDVGCGSAELTAQIAATAIIDNEKNQRIIEAIGMDSDGPMIQRAQQQFPNLSFFQGDVRNFVLDKPVDAIFSNAALHWVPPSDVELSVIAMANALKEGGRFVVEFGGKGNVQTIVKALEETIPTKRNPWYFPSIGEYTSILEEYGIEVSSAVLFDRPTPLQENDDGIKNWLRMFGNSFFEGKGQEEIEQTLEEIQEKLRPSLYDGKQWIADYRRLRIVGRKVAM